jgi:Fe-S-cluster containining protein
MDIQEFKKKVETIASERGTVWVTSPLKVNKEAEETVRMLFSELLKCQECGKCCNSFWFSVVPLYQSDYEKLVYHTKIPVEDIQKMTKLTSFQGKGVVCLKQPCGFLKDSKCSIYSNRPIVCKYFPMMIEKEVIKINVSCPAGLEVYLKLAEKNSFGLDSEGL